jgi:enamine deaminase RidA (YjgF/YER057c/UK114 family)
VTAEIQKLRALGLELPAMGPALYTYKSVKRDGDIAYISGVISRASDGSFISGKVGLDCSVEEGQQAAQACGLHLLAAAGSITGSLADIEFLKLLVMVNAAPDFMQHAAVAEGCSKLLVEVLGERGEHARSAVGVGSLPANVRVEIEAVVRVLG